MRIFGAIAVSFAVQFGAMAADNPDRIDALEKRLEQSLLLIQRLEGRVGELERERNSFAAVAGAAVASPVAASVPPAAPSERAQAATTQQSQAQAIAGLQQQVDQLSDGLSKSPPDAGLPLHGFADVGAGFSGKADPQQLRGFNAGTLDLYLAPQFADRVRSLVEVAFEYDSDSRQLSVDVERLQLGYTLNDDLTVWLGRFHTPFGVWNTWFHHGANLQTSISRPRFIDFEDKGGIIPAHSVGSWASGRFEVGDEKLSYDIYISNGPSVRDRQLDFNPLTDDDHNKMVGFNFGYHPSGSLRGLTLGVHGFESRATEYENSSSPIGRTRLLMGGAYFGYDANDWEAIGEYYRFANRDLQTQSTHGSAAGFVQIGKTFGSLTPFIRYERAALSPQDLYFTTQEMGRSYRRAAVGARYALDSRSSFKLELSATREDPLGQIDDSGFGVSFPGASYRRAAFQYSIAF
jgi:hypothetical protein